MNQAGERVLASEEVAIDLGDLGLETFTPYVVERDATWILLPLLSLLLVLIHLKRVKDPALRSSFRGRESQ